MPDRLVLLVMAAAALSLSLFTTPAFAQNEEFLGPSQVRGREAKGNAPAPRRPDGRINLGPETGKKGHWIRTRRELVADEETNNPLPDDIHIDDVPFQPWAREMWKYRRSHDDRDSPHPRCKPSAGPRQIQTAYGFEMAEFPELQQIVIFDVGGPQSWRTIYMDGRKHPETLEPTYYGHSIGWWEGDTLVVDTVGFNEKHWIDALGLMHTDQYHQIERFTRLDHNTLKYRVTIDDPGAYTEPWTAGFNLRWNEGAEVFEYICQQNNLNPEMVLGDDGAPISRDNGITP